MENWILGIHILVSFYMFGLIWFVQVVHYPLFRKVGQADWLEYEKAHTHFTSFVTAPIMIIELGTAALLWWWSDPNLPQWWLLTNFILVVALWLSTFMIQVPLHNQLLKAHAEKAIQKLVHSNWIRTVIWTVKAVVWSYLLFIK